MELTDFEGKEIAEFYKAEDGSYLLFVIWNDKKQEIKNLMYEAVGDCCSTSWFEDIDNPDCLWKAPIISVGKCESTAVIDEEQQAKCRANDSDVMEYSAYEIKTRKGICKIEFRNESNGYYGGWAQRVDNNDRACRSIAGSGVRMINMFSDNKENLKWLPL